jgi:RNA polymerase sigma factor (TIGR02999 family)
MPPEEITELLQAWGHGDRDALDRLVPLVYGELHRMAGNYMRGENVENSLQPTALIHEAYLRLMGASELNWQNRAHFFAVSAQMMRRILVDAARARAAEKRGGGIVKVDLNESVDGLIDRDLELLVLNDALEALAVMDPRKAKVVEMRFFSGLSVEETASVLQISGESVKRDWKLARAWLTREMKRT